MPTFGFALGPPAKPLLAGAAVMSLYTTHPQSTRRGVEPCFNQREFELAQRVVAGA